MKAAHRALEFITPYVPLVLRDMARSHVSFAQYDRERRKLANPYLMDEGKEFAESPVRLGIIKDTTQAHKYYVAACREMKVSYVLIDILADDWIAAIDGAACDGFLVWPSSSSNFVKEIYDTRLWVLEREMGRLIFPTWKECWLTEHKIRLRDWMLVNHIPHPKTNVFFSAEEAAEFAKTAVFPVVVKSTTGASGKGVRVLRSKTEFLRHVRHSFGSGIKLRGWDPRHRQRDYVFVQKYLPDAEEWRMVRIGDSWFGYRKEKGINGLHSASHQWSWLDPGVDLLNMIKLVTDSGKFMSMDVDIFRTREGELLVNECQTTFGCATPVELMKIDGVEGRYVHQNGCWIFEEGAYSQNHMCNLRVKHFLSVLHRSSVERDGN